MRVSLAPFASNADGAFTPGYRKALPGASTVQAPSALFHEHGVPIAEETIPLLDCNLVDPALLFQPGHRGH